MLRAHLDLVPRHLRDQSTADWAGLQAPARLVSGGTEPEVSQEIRTETPASGGTDVETGGQIHGFTVPFSLLLSVFGNFDQEE